MSTTKIIRPDVRRIIDFPLNVGESPSWDDRTGDLWFVDILAPAAICLRADRRVDRFEMPVRIGCLALCESGDIAVALEDGVHILNRKTSAMTLLQSGRVVSQTWSGDAKGLIA